jgi:hypothetical protein
MIPHRARMASGTMGAALFLQQVVGTETTQQEYSNGVYLAVEGLDGKAEDVPEGGVEQGDLPVEVVGKVVVVPDAEAAGGEDDSGDVFDDEDEQHVHGGAQEKGHASADEWAADGLEQHAEQAVVDHHPGGGLARKVPVSTKAGPGGGEEDFHQEPKQGKKEETDQGATYLHGIPSRNVGCAG